MLFNDAQIIDSPEFFDLSKNNFDIVQRKRTQGAVRLNFKQFLDFTTFIIVNHYTGAAQQPEMEPENVSPEIPRMMFKA